MNGSGGPTVRRPGRREGERCRGTTYVVTEAGRHQRDWFIVDAEGMTLGRLASVIAATLRGKTKPTFAPHMDMGDFVIVVNAEKIRVTGNKETEKYYYRHSGYPGGFKASRCATVRPRTRSASSSRPCAACCRRTCSAKSSSRNSRSTLEPNHPHRRSSRKSWLFNGPADHVRAGGSS